ncbi:hypothetical protein [Hirschia litorea]|uniref:Uncharacterized protein n=1 Tax=Hirschia litorea TaxID=1199156 RepID=A0ABW2IL80_9PROT
MKGATEKYYLQLLTAPFGKKEIPENDFFLYRELADQNILISNCETNYSSIISNIIELEKCIAINILEQRYTLKRKSITLEMQNIYPKISNLLCSCRQYLDQNSNYLEKISGAIYKEFTSSKSSFYDTVIEYKFFDKFRNHNQHKGLGINGISFEFSSQKINDEPILDYRYSALINISSLRKDKKFPQTLISEAMQSKMFNTQGVCTNIHQPILIYVACISKIHAKIRTTLKNTLKNNQERMNDIVRSHINIDDSARFYLSQETSENEIFGLGPASEFVDDVLEAMQEFNAPIRSEAFRINF